MLNRLHDRAAALAVVFALAVGCVTSAYADPESKPDAVETAEPSSGTAEGSAGKESTAVGTESSGPEPFVPSEKISADSAISFPVDI
jgi:hypothetical protein